MTCIIPKRRPQTIRSLDYEWSYNLYSLLAKKCKANIYNYTETVHIFFKMQAFIYENGMIGGFALD